MRRLMAAGLGPLRVLDLFGCVIMHGEHSQPLCDQHWQVSTWFTSQLMNNARVLLTLDQYMSGVVINQRQPLDDGAVRRSGRQWHTTPSRSEWWVFIAQLSGVPLVLPAFEEKILLYDGKKTLAVESSLEISVCCENLNSMKDYLLCCAEEDGIMQKTKEEAEEQKVAYDVAPHSENLF